MIEVKNKIMESKKYITSKSKTFKEGSDLFDIEAWISENIGSQVVNSPFTTEPGFKSNQKVKITITNLK